MTTDPTPGSPTPGNQDPGNAQPEHFATGRERADDPLLTAYALGELEGDEHAAQRAAVEQQLADDPALATQAAEIAALGDRLEAGYAASAAEPGLGEAALNALPIAGAPGTNTDHPPATPAAATPPAPPHRPVLARLVPYAAVAACAAGVTAVGFLALQGDSSTPDVVATSPPGTEAADPEDTADPPPPPAPTARERLAAALETPVTVDYDQAPLGDVLDDLRAATGVNVMTNWPNLELVGIDPDTAITLDLTDVPARAVLDYTMQQAGAENFDDDKPGYRLTDSVLEVATLAELKTQTETRTYDIRALLETPDTQLAQLERAMIDRATGFGNPSGGGLFGDSSPEGEDAPAPSDGATRFRSDKVTILANSAGQPRIDAPASHNTPQRPATPRLDEVHNPGGQLTTLDSIYHEDLPTRQERIDQTVELIQDTVGDPDEWLDEESTLRTVGGTLVVKTTPENHDQIARLLDNLASPEFGTEHARQLADDPQRIADIAALFAHDLEERMVEIREREQRRDRFAAIHDNPFLAADLRPLSTFSVDVDTASYAFVRRSLMQDNTPPPPDAVRIEEMVNYFDYGYDAPAVPIDRLDGGRLTTASLERLEADDATFTPFATHVEVADCPWADGHQLVRIGLRGMDVAQDNRPPAHLTFLLDVSGSMRAADKLPLVKSAMVLLLDQLREDDLVSIVVYAGSSGSVVEAMPAMNRNELRESIEMLRGGGSTAGAEGIELAYAIAEKHYLPGGINRVILCTDGDFNVGISDTDALVALIEEKANPQAPDDGSAAPAVYLSVFGVGTGNLNDAMMEKLTNAGNGNYAYLDGVQEAVRALSRQASGTLVTIAKDVKLQVEFNPAQVAAYRLIGYENRVLEDEDFNDDTVDAGDIGAGHTVTALYEVVPAARAEAPADGAADALTRDVDDLRYQRPRVLTDAAELPELLTLKLRFKPVDAAAEQGTSRRVVLHVPAGSVPFGEASEPTRFAAAVAAFGMVLRGSPHRGTTELSWVVEAADAARAHDPHGYREQFVRLAERAQELLAPEDGPAE